MAKRIIFFSLIVITLLYSVRCDAKSTLSDGYIVQMFVFNNELTDYNCNNLYQYSQVTLNDVNDSLIKSINYYYIPKQLIGQKSLESIIKELIMNNSNIGVNILSTTHKRNNRSGTSIMQTILNFSPIYHISEVNNVIFRCIYVDGKFNSKLYKGNILIESVQNIYTYNPLVGLESLMLYLKIHSNNQ